MNLDLLIFAASCLWTAYMVYLNKRNKHGHIL